LDPPASAVISSRRARGYSLLPAAFHQRRIDSTATGSEDSDVDRYVDRVAG
jgi:hypothetical protein